MDSQKYLLFVVNELLYFCSQFLIDGIVFDVFFGFFFLFDLVQEYLIIFWCEGGFCIFFDGSRRVDWSCSWNSNKIFFFVDNFFFGNVIFDKFGRDSISWSIMCNEIVLDQYIGKFFYFYDFVVIVLCYLLVFVNYSWWWKYLF